jgi:hypothetical protein
VARLRRSGVPRAANALAAPGSVFRGEGWPGRSRPAPFVVPGLLRGRLARGRLGSTYGGGVLLSGSHGAGDGTPAAGGAAGEGGGASGALARGASTGGGRPGVSGGGEGSLDSSAKAATELHEALVDVGEAVAADAEPGTERVLHPDAVSTEPGAPGA